MRKYTYWTTREIKMLRNGIVPPNRNINQVRVFCFRNGIKFPTKIIREMNIKKFCIKCKIETDGSYKFIRNGKIAFICKNCYENKRRIEKLLEKYKK